MRAAFGVTNKVPAVILGNKCDLREQQEVDINEVVNFASVYEDSIGYLSSAKTGENVEMAFKRLAEKVIAIVLN
jgi:GTPase SAR1 family protein